MTLRRAASATRGVAGRPGCSRIRSGQARGLSASATRPWTPFRSSRRGCRETAEATVGMPRRPSPPATRCSFPPRATGGRTGRTRGSTSDRSLDAPAKLDRPAQSRAGRFAVRAGLARGLRRSGSSGPRAVPASRSARASTRGVEPLFGASRPTNVARRNFRSAAGQPGDSRAPARRCAGREDPRRVVSLRDQFAADARRDRDARRSACLHRSPIWRPDTCPHFTCQVRSPVAPAPSGLRRRPGTPGVRARPQRRTHHV